MRIRVYTDSDEGIEISGISDKVTEDIQKATATAYVEEDSEGICGFHTKTPAGIKEYLDTHGWHFSKKLHDHAVSKMKKKDAAGMAVSIQPMAKEQVEAFLEQYGIELDNADGHDASYVANMARSDYYGSSVASEAMLAKFIKDYIDDVDGYEGLPLMRYYADCIGKGLELPWEEVI